jgi:predicted nucleic-acid-binding protein
MNPKAIDANIILRFITADHPEMAPRCRTLFERVQDGSEVVYLPEAALADTVWTLRSFYKWPAPRIGAFVVSLISQEGVRMQRKSLILDAIRLFAHERMDYSDALIAAEMSAVGLNEIYSFDRDFDKLAQISRREP